MLYAGNVVAVADEIRPPCPPKFRIGGRVVGENLPSPQQVCVYTAVAALLLLRSTLGYELTDLYHLLAALLRKTWNNDPSLLPGLGEGQSVPQTVGRFGVVCVLTRDRGTLPLRTSNILSK
jgi:hypothetical protein